MSRTSNLRWDDDDIRFVLDQHVQQDLYSGKWNNCLRVEMSPHSDTVTRFRVNQSLFLLFNNNTACLAEKEQISIM